jgi:hypothetical protein
MLNILTYRDGAIRLALPRMDSTLVHATVEALIGEPLDEG